MAEKPKCGVTWGPHECNLDQGHTGGHVCGQSLMGPCSVVDHEGVGRGGFKWKLTPPDK